jgi:hypothetical protein
MENEQIRTTSAKKAMLDALELNLGNVSSSVAAVGISRSTHYKWIEEDEEYANAVADLSEGVIDFVESALHKRIKEGDTTSMIFFLKTKGKKRGYIEKTESEVKMEAGVSLNFRRVG